MRICVLLLMLIVLIAGCVRREMPALTVPPPVVRTSVPAPTAHEVAARVDAGRMLRTVRALAEEIGVRGSGSAAEQRAFAYLAAELRAYGYRVETRAVALPRGRSSLNLWADLPGAETAAVLIGAHVDSKPPAPGANDNASGAAVVLELARVLRDAAPRRSCRFVFFGAEEMVDRHRDHHHYGSRALAADPAFCATLAGVTSLDMIGAGARLHVENSGGAADAWRDAVAAAAHRAGVPVTVGRGKPHSDHEAFERRRLPAAYLHRGRDRHYHRRSDRPEFIDPKMLTDVARVMVYAVK